MSQIYNLFPYSVGHHSNASTSIFPGLYGGVLLGHLGIYFPKNWLPDHTLSHLG